MINKNNQVIIPVVLAGGKGIRLWPLSNKFNPKPFFKINKQYSLLDLTYIRITNVMKSLNFTTCPEIITIVHKDFFHKSIEIFKQIKTDISPNNCFILEPERRSTAAAIALAAHYAKKKYGNPILLILPSDHIIKRQNIFNKIIKKSIKAVLEDKFIILSIKAHKPKTSYGYIEVIENQENINFKKIKSFLEKPNIEKAKLYWSLPNYFWNSGIFLAQNDDILKKLKEFCPNIFNNSLKTIEYGKSKIINSHIKKIIIGKKYFLDIENISIDHALFEKIAKCNNHNIFTFICDMQWSDSGSWEELADLFCIPDKEKNQILGKNITTSNINNCLIYNNEKEKKIIISGLKNIIIVNTKEGLLIINKDQQETLSKIISNNI